MNDATALDGLKEAYLQHYRSMQCFGKYFPFGTNSTQLNMTFKWRDSFEKQKQIVSQTSSLDMYSSLYNYAVALSRIGILMDLSGEGMKVASKNLCQAASIFDNLKNQVATMQPNEISPDLQECSLDMNSLLCLAQASYLFYKMAKDKGMKAGLLSQIAMQTAVYFN